MTKAVKKKVRRMKKTVRKTLGTLCLVSAITVAAIPAEGLQAGSSKDGTAEVYVDYKDCNIPYIPEDQWKTETIYTTGDGQYQFAYVTPKNASTTNKVAVIMGYNGGYLQNGALTIPDTVDAYLKYSDNLGTTSGYAAVGKNGNFLFYAEEEFEYDVAGNIIYDEVGRVDTSGNPILGEDGNQIIDLVPRTYNVYFPCYYEDYNKWKDLGVEEFYYQTGSVSGGDPIYSLTTRSEFQRITGAQVWYIGNQYLQAGTGDDAGTWTIAGDITDSSKGIFSGQGNIRTLTVGENLSGIGNYAFYGCSGMSSIKLGNGLDTIGNYAFANCINMTTVDLELYSRVDIIGDHAFYNCQALQEFKVPISVTSLGDSAFEECFAMTHVELCGEGANVSLTTIGPDVFRNCTNLESITFPRTFTNNGKAINVSMFEGCDSLKYISTSNSLIEFTDEEESGEPANAFDFDDFLKSLPDEFYFEGVPNSPVHGMATVNNFAFSHLGKDLYEITIVPDENEPEVKAVYRVNSSNQLVYTDIHEDMESVELPKTIGPYKITEIDSGTFQNNYTLKEITIPSSILSIAESAFKGCYNLEDVIFSEPVNLTYVGENAFKTQDVTKRLDDGSLPVLDAVPSLKFTGPISYDCAAFQYAMNPNSNVNTGSQQKTYITYYSGWPTNLEVRYNPTTDKNELVDYPTFNAIRSGTKYTTKETAADGTITGYAYITEEYEKAAEQAVDKYMDLDSRDDMTDYEWEIINAALQIVLPEGIEDIKAGLFVENESDVNEAEVEKTITAYSLNEISGGTCDEDGNITGGAFNGCSNLKAIYLMGGTTAIGDYAFANCEKLTDVYIPTTVTEMGLRPFTGCEDLSDVEFQGSDYFVCDNSIIYQLDENGNKQKIVEYLEARVTGVVDASELAGITEIAGEAFMATNVSSVDLRSSFVEDIPVKAFADTPKLFAVYLPNTCESISANAFKDSAVQYMEVPSSVSYIDNDAFSEETKGGLTFYCEDGSNAKLFADKNGINTTSKPIEVYYTVTFWDWDSTLLDTQTVEAGKDAVAPKVPGREGYVHTGWVPDYRGVQSDLQVTAMYEAEDPDAKKFTVTFLDHDDTVLKTTLVLPGGDAEPPFDPTREGYTFIGWRPAVTNIQANTTIYAQYEKNDSSQSQLTVRFIDYDDTVIYTQKVAYGDDAIIPQNPSREGYRFTGWRPAITDITKDLDTYAQYEKIEPDDNDGSNGGDNGGGNDGDNDDDNDGDNGGDNGGGNGGDNGGSNGGDDDDGNGSGDNGSGDNQTTTKLYTLTVNNGSGSGSYAAGSQPIIIANDPAAGQEFDYWTISPTETKIASKVLTATVITMPEGDVTVTAHYKKKTGTSVSTGSGNSSVNNSNRPNNSQNTVSQGTTVVIDKNGLSNTGVVSATVNGSSDNFTIKITESDSASEAIVRALMAEYGSDLSNIKYFAMDISLYDSTGTKKITDTTGLSIKITLPLPDSLISYAGNNKVAGVVNDRLDKLSTKFNTISGVSCVTFTAEHFSPYVIYVDTNNLTAGIVSDDTPKTGDGIHPKWFLAVGLACLSAVLFMKRDRRVVKRVHA